MFASHDKQRSTFFRTSGATPWVSTFPIFKCWRCVNSRVSNTLCSKEEKKKNSRERQEGVKGSKAKIERFINSGSINRQPKRQRESMWNGTQKPSKRRGANHTHQSANAGQQWAERLTHRIFWFSRYRAYCLAIAFERWTRLLHELSPVRQKSQEQKSRWAANWI